MNKLSWMVVPLTFGLVNCHPSKTPSLQATDCAAVVQNYLGLTDPVAVTNYIEQPSSQQVNIEYQSQDDENIPIKGIASCVFSQPNAQSISLINATINDQPLSKNELAVLNQQVKFSR